MSVQELQLSRHVHIAARQFHETRVLWHAEEHPVVVETLQSELAALQNDVFELIEQHGAVIAVTQLHAEREKMTFENEKRMMNDKKKNTKRQSKRLTAPAG